MENWQRRQLILRRYGRLITYSKMRHDALQQAILCGIKRMCQDNLLRCNVVRMTGDLYRVAVAILCGLAKVDCASPPSLLSSATLALSFADDV